MPFRPFQHMLTVNEQLASLQNISRHLERGGKLALDAFHPSVQDLTNGSGAGELQMEPEFAMPDGRRVIRQYRTIARDAYNQINDYELIYNVRHPDGRAERLVRSLRLRYFFRFEVEHLLARAGFESENIYSDYERNPFGS